MQTRVNGELRQNYNSGDMIFSHADYIEYLSRDSHADARRHDRGGSGPAALPPTGSDGRFLEAGDIIEVSDTRKSACYGTSSWLSRVLRSSLVPENRADRVVAPPRRR